MSEDDEPWANLGFQEALAVYESPSQNARVWTESWVACSMFCPNCGRTDISQYAANRPVADFACQTCHEDYELKSKKGRFGAKIVDGAYGAMMARLAASPLPFPVTLGPCPEGPRFRAIRGRGSGRERGPSIPRFLAAACRIGGPSGQARG